MTYYIDKINEKGNIAIDDTLLYKGIEAKAGSKILEGFKPLFSAEAVDRLEKKGYAIAGKTHVGEFGLDLVGEFSYYDAKGDKLLGAAAEVVAKGEVKAALGVDVNGAPRRAAALSKVMFLKPTYGTVSRYGVISTASSGEQVGVYGKSAEAVKEIMDVIAGHDDKDGTSLRNQSYDYSTDKDVKDKKVAIIKELYDKADDKTKENIKVYAEKLKKIGVEVSEISIDIIDSATAAQMIIMSAESCNNLSRYDGVKFGYRASEYRNIDELYVNTRTEGLNFLTKTIIMYGSDALSKSKYKDCFQKSLKVRRVVADSFKKLMESYDMLLCPALSVAEMEKYDIKDGFMKLYEQCEFTAIPSLIGTPALVADGVQMMGDHFSESLLLSIAKSVEEVE